MNGLNPGQMVIKIVNEELVNLMGSETTEIALKPGNEITVIMMAGLQGAGKTTTTAKIAAKLKSKGTQTACLLPATYTVRQQSNSCRSTEKKSVFEVFSMGDKIRIPVDIAKAAMEHASEERL